MQLPMLHKANLVKRYKRFLADIHLPNQEEKTIYCANTGAMTGCADTGDRVWYSISDNLKRKYSCSWEITEKPNGDFICVNTQRANQLVLEALQQHKLPPFDKYPTILPEVKYGQEHSRIDFLLKSPDLADCYIEVKSVTLLGKDHLGMFPDAKTTRGQKHLRELMSMREQGKRAVIFFAVLHSGIERFTPAAHIDPQYAQLLRKAQQSGVEVMCYAAKFIQKENRPIQLVIENRSVEINL